MMILNEELFTKAKPKDTKILLEYVSANPTGPLHIGHARGAIVGDILARLGKELGYDITSEYYVNDAGNQMKLLGLSLVSSYKKNILKQEIEYPQTYYKGEYIDDVAKDIYATHGSLIYKDENFDNLCVIAKDIMLDIIKSDLAKLNIVFDNFVSENSLYIKQDEWKSLWQKALNIDYVPSVDIRIIKAKKGVDPIAKAVAEFAKYPLKTADIKPMSVDQFQELVNQMKKKRVVAFGGILKEYRKKLALDSVEDGDLIYNSLENIEQWKKIATLIYLFQAGEYGLDYYLEEINLE
jgi:hypothetical protein